MLQLDPDHKPVLTNLSVFTNQPKKIDCPAHARFLKTIPREKFLIEMPEKENPTNEKIVEAFLDHPLFNRRYNNGFGTIDTSVYRPTEGYMQLRWPKKVLNPSFADFNEEELLIHLTVKKM